jgi:hypothetical protein
MDIVDFNEKNLTSRLYEKRYQHSADDTANDQHIIYLMDYLGASANGLNARYILTEKDYVSRDYLDGFTAYYALSFQAPPRNCKRLHFFAPANAGQFSDRETLSTYLTLALTAPDAADYKAFWQRCYLGFIVVKPLPICNIGYTVLKHHNYDPSSSRFKDSRRIWATKEYVCHLFGQELRLESLAFQEQDANLAACASMAIWFTLQMASKDHFIIPKSPGQITHDAGLIASNGNRLFPNQALTTEQMCTAITRSGLHTEVREFEWINTDNQQVYRTDRVDQSITYEARRLKRLVNAYAGLKIPLILLLGIPDRGIYDGHAVAIVGHELDTELELVADDFVHQADRMTKLYVHDDGHGGFARMCFRDNNGFDTAWQRYLSDPKLLCLPDSLIMPVVPKVRIPYEDIEAFALEPNQLMNLFLRPTAEPPSISWDIRLLYSETLKQQIKAWPNWADAKFNELKISILQTKMPKYVWVATCFWDGYETFDFVFDATEMKRGQLGLHLIAYNAEAQQFLIRKLDQLAGRKIPNDLKTGFRFMKEYIDKFLVPVEITPN